MRDPIHDPPQLTPTHASSPAPTLEPGTVDTRRVVPFAIALRVSLALLAVCVFLQAVFAGRFLGGDPAWREVHQQMGFAIEWLALAQFILAILVWRPGRGPAWPALIGLLLLSAVVVQLGLGFAGQIAVHLPLGVAIFGGTISLAIGTRRLVRRRPRPAIPTGQPHPLPWYPPTRQDGDHA